MSSFRILIDNKLIKQMLKEEFIKQGGRWHGDINSTSECRRSSVSFSPNDNIKEVVSKFIKEINTVHTRYQNVKIIKLAHVCFTKSRIPTSKILIYYIVTY